MTAIDVVITTSESNALLDTVTKAENTLERAVKAVYQRLQPALLSLLRTYPPVPPASRYRRTFRLKNNWIVTLVVSGESVEIFIGNKTPYASDVVGKLARNVETAARFQQTYHNRNGWQVAQQTVDDWLVEFIRQLEIELSNQFGLQAQGRRV